MDWSLLHPHARFKFLRQELLYSSSVPVCSIIIISSIIYPTDSDITTHSSTTLQL
jgi:hypothetical protein